MDGSRAAHDLPGLWKHDAPGSWRSAISTATASKDAQTLSTVTTRSRREAVRRRHGYGDYRELLGNKDVDAVVISTPDHWHALIAIDAVQAGKDVYLQKPASLTIAEGRALSDAVHRSGRIFQIGSQQRSSPQFRYAAELVRNGRIGQLKRVQSVCPGDPVRRSGAGDAGAEESELRHVARLDAGGAVHREARASAGWLRPPGWLRCEQFGAGMITGWGAHHIDSAHWGMDTEYTGPVEIWGTAEFPAKRPVGRPRAVQDRSALRQRRPG
jgi:predicted dehydrogenase